LNKIITIILLSLTIFISNLNAKGSRDAKWFVGLGATISGNSSAMVESGGTYTQSEYDTTVSDGLDQISIHLGYIWEMYSGYEVSFSMLNLNNSSGGKEGTLTITEIDRIIGLTDWNIGLTNQKIDLIVPFLKIGFGTASWSDNNSASSEDISGTTGKVTFGALFKSGSNLWIDVTYSIREIGFLSTKTAEQAPLQTSNVAIKYFF
jgi:hypothetical protein